MTNEELKELCENDLYFLAKNILGYSALEENPHLEMCEFLEQERPEGFKGQFKKIDLEPRGVFKTTIGTVSRAIQILLKHPDARILIFSETYSQSKGFLSEIKQHFEGNEKLIAMYGIFKKDPGWAEHEIIIRQKKSKTKEGSIMTGGVDVVRTGNHYDYIIIDDPHSQKNTSTRDQIEKVKDAYKLLLPMLEPDGEIIVIGTRWHDSDLASMLLNDSTFLHRVRAAEWTDRNGKHYYFPNRLTPEFLDQMKIDLGPYIFSCQYNNEPVDDENADFKKSWFKYFKEEEIARLSLNTFITIDPSTGKDPERGDFTGTIINSVDNQNNWYIRKAIKKKIKVEEMMDWIFDLNRIWHPLKMGIEAEKYTLVFMHFFEQECRKRNEFPPLVPIKMKISNKEDRIRSLIPRYSAGCVYHNADDPGRLDLEDEQIRFPKGEFDDVVDSLSMQSEITVIPDTSTNHITPDYQQKSRGDKYKLLIHKKNG